MTEAEWLTHAARHPHAALLYVWDGHDTPPCRPPPDATYAQHVLEHVPHLAQHQQVSRVALWNPRTVRVPTREILSMEGSMGEPLSNADGKPPGGLACGSFGLSRGSSY